MADSSSRATGPLPQRLYLHLQIIGLLLLAPAATLAMRYVQRDSQTRLTNALGHALGIPISLQAMETTLAPGLVLRGLRVGSLVGSLVDIPRVEIRLGLEGKKPRLRHLALVRPSFHVDLDHLPGILRSAEAQASRPPQNALRPSKSPTPSTFVSSLRGATWSIHQGSVDIAFHAGAHPLALHAVDLFALPSGPGRERIVVGETQIRADGRSLASLASVALDLHGRHIERAAILGGSLALPHGSSLDILTGDLHSSPHDRDLRFRIETRPPSRRSGRLVLRGRLDLRHQGPRLRGATAELRDLSLSGLGASLSPLGIHAETLRASGILDLRRDERRFQLTGDLTLQGLAIDHPRLAPRLVSADLIQLSGRAVVDPAHRDVIIPGLTLRLGQITAQLHGRLRDVFRPPPASVPTDRSDHEDRVPRVDLALHVLPTSCQAVLASMPRGFAPRLEGMAMTGVIGANAQIRIGADERIDAGHVAFDFAPLACRVRVDPPLAKVQALRHGAVEAQVTGRDGTRRPFPLDKRSASYVRLSHISRFARAAFVAAEDQRFFHHHGFDKKQLLRAFLRNLAERRFGRGASTISQQLVKNVFLDHRRNLSRKLQEAVLTWRMEQVLSKKRILELYLNVVEMGPGIHGVEQAAQAYFGIPARDLGPLQAAHLAALTPSPRPLAQRFRNRQPGPAWRLRLERILRLMRRAHTFSRSEEARYAKRELKLRLAPQVPTSKKHPGEHTLAAR